MPSYLKIINYNIFFFSEAFDVIKTIKKVPETCKIVQCDVTIESLMEKYFKNDFFGKVYLNNSKEPIQVAVKNQDIQKESKVVIIESIRSSSKSDTVDSANVLLTSIPTFIPMEDRSLQLLFCVKFSKGHYTAIVPGTFRECFYEINDVIPGKSLCSAKRSAKILLYIYGFVTDWLVFSFISKDTILHLLFLYNILTLSNYIFKL